MKLRFLGQTYSTTSKQISTVHSDNTACYRGQTYKIPAPIVNLSSQLDRSKITASVRKYRGVSYIVECPKSPLRDDLQSSSNIYSC